MKISASVYSSKETSLEQLIKDLDQHGIDYFHIDCRDNPQVFDDIEEIRRYSDTPIDLHLITANPEQYFERINALKIEFVTLQHEDLSGYVYTGGCSASMGLSIISDTEIDVFDPTHYDFILMMATIPGESGGRFDKINFRKIRRFKRRFPERGIHVDGGVNAEVSFILRNMGVHASVVGSYLFKNLPIGAALLNLKLHDIESHYTVGDFMRSREETPIVGPADRSLRAVLQTIEDYKLGFTILEDTEQRIEGIVSNADLRREVLRNVDHPEQMEVTAMINRSPIAIEDHMTVSAMLLYLKEFDFPINYLPVVDGDKKVKGVVSFLNLVKGEL
ncbi:MAG: CBS domain-containing protein [Flavobacteriales bacterium]|nr:CBS domain-containing protein [Flavobacteriales bacterium]